MSSLLKKFYHDVFVTLKRVGGSSQPAVALLPLNAWKLWLSKTQPCGDEVPASGVFNKSSANSSVHHSDNHGGSEPAELEDLTNPPKKRRRKRGERSEEDCQTKFTAIMHV